MRAFVSGQAGMAIHIVEGNVYSLDWNAPGEWVERHDWEIPLLLRGASDILQIENQSRDQVAEALRISWQKDRALQLALILLDRNTRIEVRMSAAECLNEFLIEKEVSEYVANRLYSAPLPQVADIQGAIQECNGRKLERALNFLQLLDDDQNEIIQRITAWAGLSVGLFGGSEDKEMFRREAVRHGAFRLFVTGKDKHDWALYQLLSNPHFRGDPKARAIFLEWSKPFRESLTNTQFQAPVSEEAAVSIRPSRRKPVAVRDILQQVEKQKNKIKSLLSVGDQELAMKYTEELISNQRLNSKPEHIAKSLCDLAQFAKSLGSPMLQLEFALKATMEAPTDAWSFATLGDAFRALGKFPEGLDRYQTAGELGDARIALIGRAEILKDLGQFGPALHIYEQCSRDYPNDVVVKNGRAAVLAASGRLEEALVAYDDIGNTFMSPFAHVTRSGRAQVLRDLGRLQEALSDLDETIIYFPNESVPQHIRAEVIRELGRIDEAFRLFSDLVRKFPLAIIPKNSRARLLRDQGKFEAAIQEYNTIKMTHPWDPSAFLGIADTLRKQGQLSDAITAYNVAMEQFPSSTFGRNGKASVLVAQGDYASALELLSNQLPATLSEWVAYHIRGMAYLRRGDLENAEKIFDWGITHNPWGSQRQYFKTALAGLRVQQARYEEALNLVDNVTHPAVHPVAAVLAMHVYAEIGNTAQLERSYSSVRKTVPPIVLEIRDTLYKHFTSADHTIYRRECDALLLAA